MKIFVIGASGYIGSILVKHLINSGHEVLGLARSDASEHRIVAMGATPIRGDLHDISILYETACIVDAVVYTAVDWSDSNISKTEIAALEQLLLGLGAQRPLVYTSTGLVYPPNGAHPAVETFAVDPNTIQPHKTVSEAFLLNTEEVLAYIVRPALVYGHGGPGPIKDLIDLSRNTGRSIYLDEGHFRLSTVHVDDVADLYLKILEQRPTERVFNASTANHVMMIDLAKAIGSTMKIPTVRTSLEEALKTLGPVAYVLASDNTIDASRAVDVLGWKADTCPILQDIAGV